MKIGLGQINIFWENKVQNKITCSNMISKAKSKNVELMIFPEMTLTGFSMNEDIVVEDYSNSTTIDFFKQEALQNNIAVCFGVAMKIDGKTYNKCIVIDKYGNRVADYSKIHPFSYGKEAKYYTGGNKVDFCNINGVTISPLICYDLRFPEIFQICSHKSDLIIVIANWPAARRSHWLTLLKARAIENQCFIAGVNRFGEGGGLNYSGDSIVFDPYGEASTEIVSTDGLIIADIDLDVVNKYRYEFPLKQDRHEDLYIELYKK